MSTEESTPPSGFAEKRPVYPTPEYYRDLGNQQAQTPPSPNRSAYLPQSTFQPTPVPPSGSGQPNPYQAAPMRTHNAFTRFLVNWGGGRRLALSLGSMALSILVYYYFFRNDYRPWSLAIGLTLLILVHELGHALTLRLKRLPATFPIFIPGIGAFVTLPNRPISSRDHVDISLAGPFLGGLGSLACLIISFFAPFDGPVDWTNLAYFGFYLNLINLLPLLPFDGGHVAVLLSRWLAYVGIALLAIYFLITQNFLVIYLAFIGIPATFNSLNTVRYAMRPRDQIISWVLYVGLALVLFLGVVVTIFSPDIIANLRGYDR